MGSRSLLLFVAGFACVSRTARAEDIGRDPLLAEQARPAPTPGKLADPSRGTTDMDAADPSLRGPSLADRHPSGLDEAPVSPQRRWYGWQTLLVDAAPVLGLSVAAGSRYDNQDGWIVGSIITYLVGAPIVHAAHGHGGKAGLSLGLRSLGPLLILAGVGASTSNANSESIALAVVGVMTIPAVIIVDATAIAREDVTPPGSTSRTRSSIVGFAPWFDARHGAGGISVRLDL